MAGLYTQFKIVQQGEQILIQATNASTQFYNKATSLLVDMEGFQTALAAANLDADTLAEIDALKSTTKASILANLDSLRAAVAAI